MSVSLSFTFAQIDASIVGSGKVTTAGHECLSEPVHGCFTNISSKLNYIKSKTMKTKGQTAYPEQQEPDL